MTLEVLTWKAPRTQRGRGLGATLALLAATAFAACDPCEGNSQALDCMERDPKNFVTVELQSALVGPGKVTRELWDADGSEVPTETWSQLATALAGANPYVAASALLVNPVLAGTKAPDPYGTARLDIGQGIGLTYQLADRSSNMEDTYRPAWPNPIVWFNVPLDQSLRLKVEVTDEDLVNDDSIGIAEITKAQLLDALASGKVYQVPVADQTDNQLLFLGISVRQ
jgi:hypothetical protein